MTGSSARGVSGQVGPTGTRNRRRLGAATVLLAVSGLSAGALATAGSAAAQQAQQQCPGGALLFRNACIVIGLPMPTAPPVTTPTTTPAPIISLPPLTAPPVTIPPILTPAPATTAPDGAQRLLDLANGERERAGLGQLTSRGDIVAIALAHSEEMAKAGDIFHSTRFFASAVKNLLNAGVRGENVAYNGDIDNAHARLMASAGHRANIMDPRFSVVGFGVVRAADGRFFITQNFIQPAGAPRAAAAPRPAPAPRPAAAPVLRKVAAPKPAPAPTTTVAPAPPTTVAPAPVAAPPAPALPVATLDATSTAISATSTPRGGHDVNTPLAAAAAVLLAGALCACCLVPRFAGR